MIIFQWSLRLAEGGEPPAAECVGTWLQRQFAGMEWPPPQIYHSSADQGQIMVEFKFGDLDRFEAAWPRFETAELSQRLGCELGLALEADSECRQLFSAQYLRSAVDET